MNVDIYSDIVCPWCYIGERRFARALAGFPQAGDVRLVHRPYQLDPGAPAAPVPLTTYLETRFGPDWRQRLGAVTEAAAGEGISIAWDKAVSVNTRTAHRLLGLAEREHGPEVQRALLERLFDLHFAQGGNVADVDQLVEAAAAVGMDRAHVASYLASEAGAAQLETELAQASALGIRAVPTFVFEGRWVVQGAQSSDHFLQALTETARLTRADVSSGA